jgi:hypothetical protein
MKEHQLTEVQRQILRAQVIDADHPGTVLRDFQTLLDFVGTEGVKAAGKYNLLPLDKIDELDQLLIQPLRLQLKRPQLRSHPYLQGLHLLLRASGLSHVEGTGTKTRLVVDPALFEQWNRLNPTERYFTLLEAWFLNARPEMVGEKESSFSDFLANCLQAWRSLPAPGKKYDVERPQEIFLLGIFREFYLVALMDLFGLWQIEHTRSAVLPWRPAGLKHTPFGDALLTLLTEQLLSSWDAAEEEVEEEEDDEGPAEEVSFGRWQPLLQPYFPAWQNNLVLPADESREGTFVFRVSLGKVWRSIAIDADSTLDDLVGWILKTVNFSSDHLYAFTYRDRFGAKVEAMHPAMDEGPWADEVRLGDLPLSPGQSMSLLYDFGDSWTFDVKLERIEPAGKRLKAPRILERHGKAPEQYGGWDG